MSYTTTDAATFYFKRNLRNKKRFASVKTDAASFYFLFFYNHESHAATFYFILTCDIDAAGFLFYSNPINRLTRTFQSDAGGPENLLINFMWPNDNISYHTYPSPDIPECQY